MANVNGNWKGGKAVTVVKGARGRLRTHDIPRVKRGISFQDKAYKWGTGAKATGQKAAGKIARNYKRYVGPSAKLARGIGKLGLGVGKTFLRFPGTALIGTGLYYGGKALGKKYGRGYRYSAVRQFDKRGRKII